MQDWRGNGDGEYMLLLLRSLPKRGRKGVYQVRYLHEQTTENLN